jgi:N6-adenosine-specific RNA methylase IME4|tara:strand:+ start:247 stop:783 length:537 start_codon:yes stop_codon:yes gene_type:complete
MIKFPDKKYNIIYADPAWNYETWSEGASRNVKGKYKTMSMKEIWDLPVKDICEKDCILFIWVTYPKLIDCMETIKKWGFTYKTCGFSWIKKNKKSDSLFLGMGYWTRANNEICLLATKGKPKKISSSVRQVVLDPIREHSRKPDCVRDRIVELLGDLPRIELFARQKVEGWDSWGDEV